jgi:hypothetical protein
MGRLKSKKSVPAFNKPRIEVGGSINREWRQTSAIDLVEGDTIAGAGLVVKATVAYDPYKVVVHAGYPESKMWVYNAWDEVLAFVRKDN